MTRSGIWCGGIHRHTKSIPIHVQGLMRRAAKARPVLISALAISCGLVLSPASAQELSSTFGGFATDSNAPINIESDSLTVNDAKKTAVFKGNVIAVQGDMEMRTSELEVSYSGDVSGSGGAKAKGSGGTQLTRLKAKNKVLLTSKKNQTATSDWADFDVIKQVIMIGGNVVVSQGKNIMKGEKLIIDLKTGQSRMETASRTGGSGNRVRGVFHPQRKSGTNGISGGGNGRKPVIDGWSATN